MAGILQAIAYGTVYSIATYKLGLIISDHAEANIRRRHLRLWRKEVERRIDNHIVAADITDENRQFYIDERKAKKTGT